MDPNPTNTVTYLLRAVRHWKQAVVSQEGIGSDVPAAIITFDRTLLIGAYLLQTLSAEALGATVVTSIGYSDCDQAVIVGEAYVDLGGRLDETGASLHERFADGDPSVREAVWLNCLQRSGRWCELVSPYCYHGKEVVWGEPLHGVRCNLGTRMFPAQRQAMAEGYRQQRRRPAQALLTPGARLDLVAQGDISDHYAYVAFAVTLPCPCGSRRPMNECCSVRN